MARTKSTVRLESLSAEDLAPLVGADRPTFQSALQALVAWGTSRNFRQQVMADSAFPMPDDLPAFLVVNQLVYRGAATPTDLADAIDTGRPNVSKIVTRLEEAGLVFRATDPRDNRGVVIGLTRQGRAVGRRIVAAVSRDEHNLAGWTPEEFAALERLVIKLAATIDALPGHPLTVVAGVSFAEHRRRTPR